MVYQKYGITFKNMRKQNKDFLADFFRKYQSSTLSDFERGLTMISLEKIDLALQLMGCSLSDFDSHLNFYSPTDPIYILKELERAILFNDSPKLKDLYMTCKQTKQRNLCLTIKFLLKKGTLEEKNEIVNFLMETKAFGIKELSIFLHHHLAPQDILNIMLKNMEKGCPEIYHRHLSHVILEVITVLSNYGLKDEAYYFIKELKNSI